MLGLANLVCDECCVGDSDDGVLWLVDGKSRCSTSGKPLADDHVCGEFVKSFRQVTHPLFGISEIVHKMLI